MKDKKPVLKSRLPDAEQFSKENPVCSDVDLDFFGGLGLPDDEISELIHFSGMTTDNN